MTKEHPISEGSTSPPADLRRYSRQVLCEQFGEDAQRRLMKSKVVLFGCGALGTVLAETLVRAGVGFLRICDRDFIEEDNLQRQVLFDETDIEANLPKAQAAAEKLRRINSTVGVESVVIDVNHTNIERLSEGADLLLDGTDNFETRFLINDFAVSHRTPWIYGAVIGTTGLVMPIIPHDTPCLRCVFEEPPPPEMNPTCDTAGVLGPAVMLAAALQAMEAMKLLSGRRANLTRGLANIDVWTGRVEWMNVQNAYDKGDCPCCKRGELPFLKGERGGSSATLCGRNAVQVRVDPTTRVDLAAIAAKLENVADTPVRFNRFMLRATVDGHEMTLFPDGRAIVKGTDSPDKARTLYAKYFGA